MLHFVSALLQLGAGWTPHVAQPTLPAVGFPPLVAALPPDPLPTPRPFGQLTEHAPRVTVGQNIESEWEQGKYEGTHPSDTGGSSCHQLG